MSDYREVAEGTQYQGADESIARTVTTTNWGSSPSSVSVVVKSLPAGTDVTSTAMPTNSPTVSGNVITLSPLTALTAGTKYKVEVKFTAGGSTWECYHIVVCTT